MKAVRLYQPGDLRVEEVEIPQVADDEALIKVMAVGVCGSDIPRVNRYGAHIAPLTVGHEFGGVIERLGKDVRGFSAGDRVTVPPLIPCYKCKWCKMGEYSLCESYDYYGSRRDGAMAQYISVKDKNLLKVAPTVPFEALATIDPCANAVHGMIRGGLKAGETVCVYGAGPIGLFVIQYAKVLGPKKVIAVDILHEKLSVASLVGADTVINGAEVDASSAVLEETGGAGADLVIDLTGVPSVQNSAVLSANKFGRIVFLGISHKSLELSEKAVDAVLRRQLCIIGSWNSFSHPFPGREWTESVRLFEEGKLSSKYIISHRLPLEEAPEIFAKIGRGGVFFNKIMFFPWGN